MRSNRNLSIESLRGITILLVVIGHVIGSDPTGGMKIDFPHPLRYIYLWIGYIQMPLFTAIAGWVYALKPLDVSLGIGMFIRKKALRLLVPMVVVVTLYFLLQYIIPGTNNKGDLSQIWRIYVFPYTIYWYLPSLFLIFVIQALIDSCRWMVHFKQWGFLVILSLALSQTNDIGIMHEIPNFFSFKGALGQLPYFLTGVGVYRFSLLCNARKGKWISALAVAFVCVVLIQLVWLYPGETERICRMLYAVVLIPTLVLLLSLKWHNKYFVWIGAYAYSIYLLHGFGTSGSRIILKILGVKSVALIFIFATFVASACPIVIDKIIARWRLGRLLLGK